MAGLAKSPAPAAPAKGEPVPPTNRAARSIEDVIALRKAGKGSAPAPTPEKAKPAGDGPEGSKPAAEEVARDSADGEDVQEQEVEQEQEIAEDDAADAKDPVYQIKVAGEEKDVPLSELIKGYQLEADYTRKSQALAERSKTVEAQAKEYQEQLGAAQSERTKLVEQGKAYDEAVKALRGAVDAEAATWDKVDWTALKRDEPADYLLKRDEYRLFQERRSAIKAEEDRRADERKQIAAQETKEAQGKLARHFTAAYPQWKDEQTRLRDWSDMDKMAEKLGYTLQERRECVDPRMWDLIYRAAQFDRSETAKVKAGAVTPKKTEPAQPIKLVRPDAPRPSSRTARSTEVAATEARAMRLRSPEAFAALRRAQAAARR